LSFNNFNQVDSTNDLFLSVLNDGNLGSMIFYNNYTNLRFLFEKEITDLSLIDIRITDDTNNLLDFNNQDIYITFQIDIEYIPTNTGDSFSNILNQIKI
jgi:hypothetical protein